MRNSAAQNSSVNDKTDKKTVRKNWLIRVVLPSVIFAIIVIWAFIAINYQAAPNYHNQADYRITGDTAWVGNREWQVYNPDTNETLASSNIKGVFTVMDYGSTANFVITHPDWFTRFLVTNTEAKNCQTTDFDKDLKKCANNKTTELKLDHNLDIYLQSLSSHLVNHQWDRVSPLAENKDDTPLSTQLADWTDKLAERDFTTTGADVYVNITDKDYLAGKPFKATFIWQLINSETGGVRVINSEPVIYKDGDSFKWEFDAKQLPKVQLFYPIFSQKLLAF